MQIVVRETELVVDGAPMRVRIAAPKARAKFPGVLLYSEIFQLTGPIRRSMDRLAGHGFVVAAPEIFHRVEAPGVVIPYDDAGRDRGLADAKSTFAAEHDRDRSAVLDLLETDPAVDPDRLCVMGFCIGGHTMTHPFLNSIDPDWAFTELVECKRYAVFGSRKQD